MKAFIDKTVDVVVAPTIAVTDTAIASFSKVYLEELSKGLTFEKAFNTAAEKAEGVEETDVDKTPFWKDDGGKPDNIKIASKPEIDIKTFGYDFKEKKAVKR